ATRLENPLEIVRWNLDKRYLREMEQRGARIVPTIWDAQYNADNFSDWQSTFDNADLIIKPYVSATAEHTYRLASYDAGLETIFAKRQFMVQPFMPNIVDEGEFSLFFFNGEYSHAINKQPKPADFRVQEEHGGIITEVFPDAGLLRAATETLAMIGRNLLYARIDFVRDETDNFALMELELIEPALYLRMNDGAPERFAAAIDKRTNGDEF
ncbi:MAG: ATP-grasp domain-containing protein, partial [Pyrinomonadaceae bacterium]